MHICIYIYIYTTCTYTNADTDTDTYTYTLIPVPIRTHLHLHMHIHAHIHGLRRIPPPAFLHSCTTEIEEPTDGLETHPGSINASKVYKPLISLNLDQST